MTLLIDGPAAKVSLSLKRTPRLLRVTQDRATKEWDALDLLTDVPRPGEDVYVYQAKRVIGFLCGGRGAGPMVEYFCCHEQPPDEVLRDNRKWAQWCADHEDLTLPG